MNTKGNNEQIEDYLNRITNNTYNFQFKSAKMEEDGMVNIVFKYDDGTLLSPEDKTLVRNGAKSFLEDDRVNVEFIKNFVDEGAVENFVNSYIKDKYTSIKFYVKNVTKQDNVFTVTIVVADIQAEYVKSRKLKEDVVKNLLSNFDAEFVVALEFQENMLDFKKIETKETVKIEVNQIVVTNVVPMAGKNTPNTALYIRGNNKAFDQEKTFCGHVKGWEMRFTRPKIPEGETNPKKFLDEYRKKEYTLEERLANGQRVMFRFKLEDFTDGVDCVIFPKKGEIEKCQSIIDGDSIILSGKIVKDYYDMPELRVESLARCTLPEPWEEKIEYLTEKPYYEFVEPEHMVYTDQVGLFSMSEERPVAPFLKGKEFVVFDFETTGLNAYSGDKIVEIGAVKVIDGAIVQSFRTLVNPERDIPAEASAVHKIFKADVIGAPKAEQALQDFYKFTRGSILVGYNVGFDYGFLDKQGKECRYLFENKVFDVYKMAQKYVKSKTNYKLKNIAKELGIDLVNAHSALFDTIATAEVFIKLAWKMQPTDNFWIKS